MTQMPWLRTKFAFMIVMTKWSLSVTEYWQKCPRNRTINKKRVKFCRKIAVKFQTKAQNSSKVHLFWEIWGVIHSIHLFQPKGGPIFLKLFPLDQTDPLSFGPKFRKILVEWITPLVTCTGEQKISVASARLPDNLGELACIPSWPNKLGQ